MASALGLQPAHSSPEALRAGSRSVGSRMMMCISINLTLVLACLFCFLEIPARAFASGHRAGSPPQWQQYDTAVYVVSTLNLFETPTGEPLTRVWQEKLGVRHYDVYADTEHRELYFIELKRSNGATVGTFAYRLGWPGARLIAGALPGLREDRVPVKLLRDYLDDRKLLLASLASTLPDGPATIGPPPEVSGACRSMCG